MKKFFKIFAFLFLGLNLSFAQETDSTQEISDDFDFSIKPMSKKGQMFVFWGWNRAAFTKSDIHFRGNGYDFTLENVVAHDRPSELDWAYVDPGQISKPQFNFRLGYFIKDNLALVVGTDHMKYVMDRNRP